MLTLKVKRPDGTVIEVTTNKKTRLRLRYKAKKPAPVVVLVQVPVVKTVYLAPPPAPSPDDIAYAILQELEGHERLYHNLQKSEEEVLDNGQQTIRR